MNNHRFDSIFSRYFVSRTTEISSVQPSDLFPVQLRDRPSITHLLLSGFSWLIFFCSGAIELMQVLTYVKIITLLIKRRGLFRESFTPRA
jgi:hypothetical protein